MACVHSAPEDAAFGSRCNVLRRGASREGVVPDQTLDRASFRIPECLGPVGDSKHHKIVNLCVQTGRGAEGLWELPRPLEVTWPLTRPLGVPRPLNRATGTVPGVPKAVAGFVTSRRVPRAAEEPGLGAAARTLSPVSTISHGLRGADQPADQPADPLCSPLPHQGHTASCLFSPPSASHRTGSKGPPCSGAR